ncbi:zinc transporter ZIP10-like [Haliotis cracherodii]|uniref:zinc transporter ZIP10-like n=1 Tax=Haliotis cracherodii TaxID=6455 RepID=UPI0039E94F43
MHFKFVYHRRSTWKVKMCVMHRFCVVCYCLCLLCPQYRSDEDASRNHLSNSTQTGASKPRDQHVKNVSLHHIHKHDNIETYGNNSLREGLYFARKVFQKFGNEDELTILSFKKLLDDLKIFSSEQNNSHVHHDHINNNENHDHNDVQHSSEPKTEHNHDIVNHKHDEDADKTAVDAHEHEDHSGIFPNGSTTIKTVPHESERHDDIQGEMVKRDVTTHHEGDHMDCLDSRKLLDIYHLENKKSLTLEQFLHISPAVIYQLDNPGCQATGHRATGHPAHSMDVIGFSEIPAAVWGYSTLAVVIISLVGLLGVAVIPIMQKVFYNHMLQFLIALAVGTLTGDALLHLLPHAIIGHRLHNHDNHGAEENGLNSEDIHKTAAFKGLCGLAGMFFFFVMERILTIVTDIKRKRKLNTRRTLSSKQKTVCKDDRSHIAKKLSAYDEPDYQSCEEMVMVVHPNKSLKGFADETHHKVFHTNHDSCRPKEDEQSPSNPKSAEEEGMLSSLPHSHSGHSHHGHCEMLSNSVASIAWMVILGDGIHNFSDGLAIGAAFANSITGGFSTAVAVFCHELPHEIGDFAVLLRAGMSVKQAVVYNCVSSLLCFVGMLIGVAIGNIHEASEWIFACVAGMFIYIATVDMLPEMTSVDTKQGEHPFCHLFLQCFGMLLGAGIMLLIAFYEDDLLTVLGG